MLINTIGNTPMIKINYEYKGKNKYIYTKLEYYNLTGSIKDRVAYYIINNAMKRGELKEGMPIIEATSGNTGIALAALGRFYNHPVYIFMPDWVSKERKDLIRNYGANIILFSKEEGGFIRCVEEANKMVDLDNKKIPEDIDYDKIHNLASEAKQKLKQIRPTSIGQALRISGVNPADISLIMVYIKKEYFYEQR